MQSTTGHPPPPPGVAFVLVPSAVSASNIVDRYQHKRSIQLGICQIIVGIGCVLWNTIALAIYHPDEPFGPALAVFGHGFWTGIPFIISGSLGIAAGKTKTRCKIVAFMVLCIVSAALTPLLLLFAIIGAIHAQSRRFYCSHMDYRPRFCENDFTHELRTITAMHSLLAIFGVIDAVIAIWGSAICCKAVCCGANSFANSQYQAVAVNYLPTNNADQNQREMFISGSQIVIPIQQGVMSNQHPPQLGLQLPASTNVVNGMVPSCPPAGGHTPPPYYSSDQAPLWSAKFDETA